MSIVFFSVSFLKEMENDMERFETKYDLLNRVYQDSRLKRTTKALMQYMVAKSDELSCHPSVATIAAAIRMSERTVQRHMRQLEQYGYLIRKSRYYRQEQLTNQYEFVLDVVDSTGLQYINRSSDYEVMKQQAEQFCPNESRFNKMQRIKKLAKTGLSNKECLVLIYFIHKANQNGITYGKLKEIGRELHISQRLLCKVILELRTKGFLMLKNRRENIIVKLLTGDDDINQDVVKDRADGKEILYPESRKVSYENRGVVRHGRDARWSMGRRNRNLKQMLMSGWKKLQRILMHFLS